MIGGVLEAERAVRAKVADRREADRDAGRSAQADDAELPERAAATEGARQQVVGHLGQ